MKKIEYIKPSMDLLNIKMESLLIGGSITGSSASPQGQTGTANTDTGTHSVDGKENTYSVWDE